MDFVVGNSKLLLHLNLYSEVWIGQKRNITRVEDYGWSCLVFKIKEKWNRIKRLGIPVKAGPAEGEVQVGKSS